MGNGRLYSTLGSYLISIRFPAPMAASEIQPMSLKIPFPHAQKTSQHIVIQFICMSEGGSTVALEV
jgi:hypothetical protein